MTPMQAKQMNELHNILQFEPPMSIYRNLIDTLGSVKCALLLSQYLFITKVRAAKVGDDVWMHRTSQQMLQETALSYNEYKRARAQLIETGLLIKQIRVCAVTGAPEVWVKVDFKRLSYLIAQSLGIDIDELLTIEDLITNSQKLKVYLRFPLPYRKIFARITGGVNTGLMMTCLLRSLENGHDVFDRGFVSKSIDDWSNQIGIGWSAQKNSRNTLTSIGFIKERHLWRTRTIFTEIEFDTIIAKVKAHYESAKAEQNTTNEKGTFSDVKRDFLDVKKGLSKWCKTVNTDGAISGIRMEQNQEYGWMDNGNMDGAKPEIVKYLELKALTPPTNKDGAIVEGSVVSGGVSKVEQTKAAIRVTYFWPKSMLEVEKASITVLFERNGMSGEVSQTLIDELAGRLRKSTIDNKVGYVRSLINRYEAGSFIAEMAIGIQKQRMIEMSVQQERKEKIEKDKLSEVADAKSRRNQQDRHQYLRQLLGKRA